MLLFFGPALQPLFQLLHMHGLFKCFSWLFAVDFMSIAYLDSSLYTKCSTVILKLEKILFHCITEAQLGCC